MTIEEAIKDPKRPLSISPRDWALSMDAELEEENELIEKSSERIASEQKDESFAHSKESGWEKIDIGIDQIIQGCQILEKGIWEANMKNLSPECRSILDAIKDIFQSAIVPYMADIVQESEKIK